MNKLFVTIVSLFLINTISYSQINSSEYISKQKSLTKKTLTTKSLNTPKHTFDVLHYNLNIDLYSCYSSPYPKNYKADVSIKIKVDSALNNISLNAVNSSLDIDSITLISNSFTHTNDILQINFTQTYNPGEVLEFKIFYKHKDVSDNAFYCNNGFVFTDSEPIGARKWLPCWDFPSDKATFELKAKVPSTVLLASNGLLIDSLKTLDTIYYHWKSRDPIATYLMIITSKKGYNLQKTYVHTSSNPQDSIEMRFYFNNGENPMPIINIMQDMVNFFSNKFTPHPFEKNGFATLNSDFQWGGMENQTLTSLCPGCWEEILCLHEFAHQWFGDMITCASWSDLWINEGFATFSEALWKEYKNGYPSYKIEIISKANYYLSHNPGWAISSLSWATNSPTSDVLFNYAVTYQKGACVLHQLRYVLGDTMFFNGLKQYSSDTTNFKYKNSTIGDFFAKMEQVSGQDLQWFMNQWIYTPNHPIYENNLIASSYPNNGIYTALLTVNQTSNDFFKMPLEFKIRFEDNSDTLIKVINNINNQTFYFEFSKKIISYSFDPNLGIVLKSAQNTINIEENLKNNAIQIYLNPSSNSINIKFLNHNQHFNQIQIFDLKGSLIKDINIINSTSEINIDISKLPQANYFIKLFSDKEIFIKKFSKN